MADEIVREEQARQGPKGKPVLYVLVGSLILLGAFLAMYMFWASSAPTDSAHQNAPQAAPGGTATGTTAGSGNPTNRTLPANPAYPAPTDATTGARPAR